MAFVTEGFSIVAINSLLFQEMAFIWGLEQTLNGIERNGQGGAS